jgi:hypothetical protein
MIEKNEVKNILMFYPENPEILKILIQTIKIEKLFFLPTR